MVLMSTWDDAAACDHPEIAGKRVLVTGLTSTLGVDVARTFADNRARLILHTADDGAEMQAVAEIAARSALDMRLFTGALGSRDGARMLARTAVQCFGGLDIVINLVELEGAPRGRQQRDIEHHVAEVLAAPYLISRIAANRMRLTLTQGLIVNVAVAKAGAGDAGTLAAILRATLAAMTRKEAEAWAVDAIRFNAVAPFSDANDARADVACEGDLAALVLRLAGRRGRALNGLMFSARR